MKNLENISPLNSNYRINNIENFKQFYKKMDKKNIETLKNIYHKDIIFIDPFHKIESLNQLEKYFKELYQNLESIDFSFGETISNDNNHTVNWCMHIKHPKLNKNKLIDVWGCSHIKYKKEKVIYHRDYFDTAAMLYEQLPIIGRLIRFIKSRV